MGKTWKSKALGTEPTKEKGSKTGKERTKKKTSSKANKSKIKVNPA